MSLVPDSGVRLGSTVSKFGFWQIAWIWILLGVMNFSCQPSDDPDAARLPAEAGSRAAKPPFEEVAGDVGLDFVYENGFEGEYQMPEITAGGIGLIDFDNDGDLDVYAVQGGHLKHIGSEANADRLFRNDMSPGKPATLKFTDVTEAAGIRAFGYGQGVAIADYNNDGWADIFVTNFGANQLWRNLGDGSFKEVSATSGVQDDRWSVSATFFDPDRDGDLDLYVGNYCEYDVTRNEKCFSPQPDYCNPVLFPAAPDSFWRNNGDGTFENHTISSGLAEAFGRALGVLAVDVNSDGWLDLYVANDLTANQLWMNQGNGRFVEKGMISGTGVVFNGLPGASMGVDAGDFDNDGDEDLFMTHLVGQLNTLYENDGAGNFRDRTQVLGLGGPSLPHTGFGTAFLDYDNDGWLDLVAVNGAVRRRDELVAAGETYPFQEKNLLFHNKAGQGYRKVLRPGPGFEKEEISRGAAIGDLDNDGDTDILVVNINGPLRFLKNQAAQDNRWIGFRLLGLASKRDILGSRLVVTRQSGQPLWRRSRTDGSYASSNDPRVLTGLGPGVEKVDVEVFWADGSRELWVDLSTNRYWTLEQGEGNQNKIN